MTDEDTRVHRMPDHGLRNFRILLYTTYLLILVAAVLIITTWMQVPWPQWLVVYIVFAIPMALGGWAIENQLIKSYRR